MHLVFISGPIRGVNWPERKFYSAARRIWNLGAVPFNPLSTATTIFGTLSDDQLVDRYCEAIESGHFSAIYCLPESSQSSGSCREQVAARKARCVFLHHHWDDAILWTALRAVDADVDTEANEGR